MRAEILIARRNRDKIEPRDSDYSVQWFIIRFTGFKRRAYTLFALNREIIDAFLIPTARRAGVTFFLISFDIELAARYAFHTRSQQRSENVDVARLTDKYAFLFVNHRTFNQGKLRCTVIKRHTII